MTFAPACGLSAPSEFGDEAERAAVYLAHGATPAEAAELRAYARSTFAAADVPASYPLPDEPFVATWERYAAEAERDGVAVTLRRRLVQLRFPIALGVSETAAYRAAMRRGVVETDAAGGVQFTDPARLRLFLHPSAAGRIPVIVAGARADFVALVRALTRRNEPAHIPDSMGACVLAGYTNWDRVAELRREWERASPAARGGDGAWAAELRRLAPRKELYQDRFIVLGSGPYSGTPASAIGLADETWWEASATIRLEHECAHYFTRRVFGSMRNSLLDEIIADYTGIVAAVGRFRADWFLRFMGLERFPSYRAGGRLENYRGEPALSDGAFAVLQRVLVSATRHLESFDSQWRHAGSVVQAADMIVALARLGLEGLAGPGGDVRLAVLVAAARGAPAARPAVSPAHPAVRAARPAIPAARPARPSGPLATP